MSPKDKKPYSIKLTGITSMNLSLHQNETHQVKATVENREGQALNVSVTWHTSDSTIATVSTNGLVTAKSVVGTANIFASVGSIVSPILIVTNLGPLVPPLVLTSYSVTPATTTPVAFATDLITIQALDQNGNPINQAGIDINFVLSGAGGSLSASSGITNSAGQVTVTLTVGASTVYTVRATDTSTRTGISASITAGAAPPPPPDTTPASITILNNPFSGHQSDNELMLAVVKNAAGDILPQAVTWASSVSGVASINSSSGLAVIGATIGTTNITASIGALSSSVLVVTGLGPAIPPLTITSYQVTPSTLAPAANVDDPITAQALDQNGDPIAISGIVINWSKSNITGSFSIPSSITDANGRATVNLHTAESQTYQVIATDNNGKTGISDNIVSGGPINPPPSNPTYPNQPSGFNQLVIQPFDQVENAYFYSSQPNNPIIVVDPTNPGSSQNVAQMLFPINQTPGSAPAAIFQRQNFVAGIKSLYVHFYFKISANWVASSSGENKILYGYFPEAAPVEVEIHGSNGIPGGDPDSTNQHMITMPQIQGIVGVTGVGTVTVNLPPNQVAYGSWPEVFRNIWHRYELLFILNTSGHADGTVKYWFNNVLLGDYSNVVEWSEPVQEWAAVAWNPIYNGPNLLSTNQYMYLKDLYVSGN